MQPQRPAAATRPLTVRAAISNGTRLLPGVDGRSAAARRYRDLIADFAADCGGVGMLSPAELGLVRQAAAITLRCEQMQAAVVLGETVDGDELIRLSSEARRILANLRRLGLERMRAQAAPPLLEDYLAAKCGHAGDAA